MTLVQKWIAEGEAKGAVRGEAKGREEGKWIGKLQLLEELLGGPVTPEETLQALTPAELEKRYRDSQTRYDAQFKRQS